MTITTAEILAYSIEGAMNLRREVDGIRQSIERMQTTGAVVPDDVLARLEELAAVQDRILRGVCQGSCAAVIAVLQAANLIPSAAEMGGDAINLLIERATQELLRPVEVG